MRPVVLLLLLAGAFWGAVQLANSLRDRMTERRPPAEIPAEGALTIALTGDTSLVPPAPRDGASRALADLIRQATLGFTNLELTIEEPRRDRDSPLPPGPGRAAPPDAAEGLRALGFDIVSLANNHATDFGADGLLGTIHALDAAGVVSSGAGADLEAASLPAVFGHEGGRRVAFVSVTASTSAEGMASPSQADIRGRPGVNPLRFLADVTVDGDTFRTLAASIGPLNAGPPPGERELTMFGQRIVRGDHTVVRFTVNGADRERVLASIRAARAAAGIVVVSIHSHEPFNGSDSPADFIRTFAHDAIEAGAQVVVGHGPHRVRGMERYRGGVVFYSLGHYAFGPEALDLRTADAFDAGRNLYGLAIGTSSEALSPLAQLEDARWWEGLAVTARFEGDGRLAEVAIRPVVLSRDRDGRGVPGLATGEAAVTILRRFADLSAALGEAVPLTLADGAVVLPISQKW